MTLRAAGLVLLALGAALPAGAEDAKALLKKVESRIYYPQENGLKDLSANLVLEGGGGGPGASMSVKVFWKAPDKRACQVELPEEVKSSPMAGMVQGMMEKAVAGIVGLIVPLRLGAQEANYDYAAEADGDLTKITGRRKADVKDKTIADEVVMWVDAKATPVKMATVANGQRTEMSEFAYEEKDGKLLMSGVTVSGVGGPGAPGGKKGATMKLEYVQVDSIWLVKGAKIDGAGGGGGYTVKDHVVNKGVDDAVFAPKAAPAGGMKLPAGDSEK